jgi:protease-4
VLVIDISERFPEQERKSVQKLIQGTDEGEKGLYDVVRMIRYAKTDADVKGIYLKVADNANGFAASEELRNALADFKRSGKFIIAYGDMISQKAYYVANVADKIYTNPQGGVEWRGYSLTMYFLKGLLDKLEIEPQIFYAGQFKSATEPYRVKQMTEPNRIQMTELLDDLYSRLLNTTSAARNVDTATLRSIADNGNVQTADDAIKYKLIDGKKFDDEVKAEVRQWLKLQKDGKINFISTDKYAESANYKDGKGTARIAVIYAEGEIIGGKNPGDEMIAGDHMRDVIRKARLDKNVKAIVFRVNSPGGSALASDIIWREITLAKKDKPVVVSMGDYAASGGYYIACAADSIFADQNTLTGSIGVFSIIPNMSKFFNNKLGVTFDGVKTGQYADMMTSSRPLNEKEKQFLTIQTENTYRTFKQRVAEGRKKDTAYIESIAQGRVWTGATAVKNGLVDKIGTLNDAINCAARMCKQTDYRVREYPEQQSVFQQFFSKTSTEEVKQQMIKDEIGADQFKWLKQLKKIKAMVGTTQARLPFDAEIR